LGHCCFFVKIKIIVIMYEKDISFPFSV